MFARIKAIDFLDENKDVIEEQLYYQHTDLFSGQLDLVFFDTTSTYVEGDAGAFDLLDYGAGVERIGCASSGMYIFISIF